MLLCVGALVGYRVGSDLVVQWLLHFDSWEVSCKVFDLVWGVFVRAGG